MTLIQTEPIRLNEVGFNHSPAYHRYYQPIDLAECQLEPRPEFGIKITPKFPWITVSPMPQSLRHWRRQQAYG